MVEGIMLEELDWVLHILIVQTKKFQLELDIFIVQRNPLISKLCQKIRPWPTSSINCHIDFAYK